MWYVVQVKVGTEEDIKAQCKVMITDTVLEDCFIFYYEQMKKYKGAWHREKKVLFPGYVFMVSCQLDALYFKLKEVSGLTKMLGVDAKIVPLDCEEVLFLQSLGKEAKVVEMSEGIIEEGIVYIIEGPLKGYEGCIKRIDRHKRLAYLELEMMGRKIETQVGLEIIEKKKVGA